MNYTQEQIDRTYKQGQRDGQVIGVFCGIILSCLFAILILSSQL